jgi:hypothetical protein
MKKSSLIVFIILFLLGAGAQAHIVGTQAWCLVFSPFHQECTFDSEPECIKNMKRDASLSTANDPRPIPKGFEKYCSENDTSKPKSFFDKPF